GLRRCLLTAWAPRLFNVKGRARAVIAPDMNADGQDPNANSCHVSDLKTFKKS
nr:hypothetical protein [Tanacetum cinerariifolium]